MSGVYNQGPVREDRDTTMRDLIGVLFKRKWLILSFFVVALVVTVGRVATQADTFSADARVLLKRQGARSSVLERNPRMAPWVEVVETELEVIQTEPVMRRAVAKLARPSDEFPEGIEIGIFGLSSSISVGVINESNVLYVQGTAEDPRKAVAITNAVAEAYVEHHKELFALPEVQTQFAARADSVLAALDAARIEQQVILEEFGLTNFEDEERSLIRQRESVGRELIDYERKITRLEVEVDDVRNVLKGENVDLPIKLNTGSVQGNGLLNTIAALNQAEKEIDEMRGRYTDNHPEVQELERDRLHLRAQLQKDVDALVTMKAHELRVAQREAGSLRGAIREIESRLAQLPDATRRVASLNTRIKALEEQYDTFSEYIANSQATERSFQEYAATVISRAIRAQKDVKADMVRVALAPLLALLAGIFAAFYLENMDHSLGTREDVERHLDIPVLASFPESELDDSSPEEVAAEDRRRAPFQRSRAQRG